MNKSIVWFALGLLIGLGVLLGAMLTGKGEVGRYQVYQVQVENVSDTHPTTTSKAVVLLDTVTGRACQWVSGTVDGKGADVWAPITEVKP